MDDGVNQSFDSIHFSSSLIVRVKMRNTSELSRLGSQFVRVNQSVIIFFIYDVRTRAHFCWLNSCVQSAWGWWWISEERNRFGERLICYRSTQTLCELINQSCARSLRDNTPTTTTITQEWCRVAAIAEWERRRKRGEHKSLLSERRLIEW